MLIDDLLDGILRVCAGLPGDAPDEIARMIADFRSNLPVSEVRTALRYTTLALDAEIALMIDAAKEDLGRIGVEAANVTSALGRLAIMTYARAQQADDPEMRASLMDSYNAIGDALRKGGSSA